MNSPTVIRRRFFDWRRPLPAACAAALGLLAAGQTARPAPATARPPPAAEAGVLTNLESALGLPLPEAQRGRRVQATATVTYCHPQWGMLFVQGAELGTFLKIPLDTPPLAPGDGVRIEGLTTTANGYAEIKVEKLVATGQRRELAPQSWSLEDVLNGRAASQWVELEGRVLAAFGQEGRLRLQLVMGGTNLTACLLHWQPELAEKLLDSRVRVRGVVSIQFDQQGRRTGVLVLAQEPEQLRLMQAAALNPLDLPVTPISRLAAPRDGQPAPRVHLQGSLERLPDGVSVSVRDQTGSLRLRCVYVPELPPDSRVEVFGYPDLGGREAALNETVVLPAGSTATPGSHVAPAAAADPAALPWLQSAQAVHQLSRSEAARGCPVRLDAVVTFCDSRWWSLFVQDATGAVYVSPANSQVDLHSGQRVRVCGVTAPGDFAPTVEKATFEVLGEAALPVPARGSPEALLTGQLDCRWVEISGVAQSVVEQDHRCWLFLMTAQGQIPALLGPAITLAQAEELVNARVTLRGAAGGEFNRQGQIIAVRLHVPDLGAIRVDEAPSAHPFATPARLIADLSRYQPESEGLHRVKVAGRVTSLAPDKTITLQDQSGGLQVRLMRRDRMPRVGEQIEILGFPAAGDFAITLKDAWSRITGPGGPPPALPLTAEEILARQPNARLVRLEARLIRDTWLRPGQTLVLHAGSVVFEAVLPDDLAAPAEAQLEANTGLQVTGVCLLEGGRWEQARSFRLRVRQLGDLKILTRPPWWTAQKLSWTLGGASLLVALGAVWGALLSKKNRLLGEQVRERERVEAELRRTQAALQEANGALERRVEERTAELRQEIVARDQAHAELAAAQKELVETSRLAGMAELATGVLHNVGNVLNSVNVSTTIIRDKLRRSEFLTLGKLRNLLQQHQHDLPVFLTTDPKGKLVPGFIIKLADNLDKELSSLQTEHEQLTRNVEHIKEIVATQQSYARVIGSRERLSLASLVDDALQMNSGSFASRGIRVVRHYAEVPKVLVDKHKVLQILVNLLTNAKHALDESGRPDPRLTLEIGAEANRRLKVAVSDNGVGIPPENLARIFSRGFTTRKTGHGFGLHSGANAAKEMGGQLTVRSEGPGQGATFTLELPLEDPATP